MIQVGTLSGIVLGCTGSNESHNSCSTFVTLIAIKKNNDAVRVADMLVFALHGSRKSIFLCPEQATKGDCHLTRQ